MAVCRLGQCTADAYRVIVRDRTGREVVEVDFEQLNWERTMDKVGEATVEVSASCCGKLADVEPWRHELSISRDGTEQWVGPLRPMAYCVSGLVLKATDMFGWLERRVIHENHDWTASVIGAVTAAVELIKDGFEPDDPDVLKYLTSYEVGDEAGRSYAANSAYVIDALNDLAKGSIDYTSIGRRLIIMPSGHSLGRTAMLTCNEFKTDLCTVKDGDAYTSRAVVTGKGVTGEAGGTDPYYGLVETLLDDQAIGKLTTANSAAAGLLKGRTRVPVLIQPPQGAGLNPDAPVCLEQLVPGVTVPVAIDCTCRTAVQDMRLIGVSVSVSNEGENVSPQLAPLDFSSNTSE